MKKLLIVFALFMIAVPAMAQNKAETIKDSYCTYWYAACCDYWLDLCVDVHAVNKYTYDEATDTYRYMWHYTLKGRGTGYPSGDEYTMKEIYNENAKYDPASIIGNSEYRWRIVSKDGCSFILKIKMHVTMKDGVPIVERYEVTEECENGMLE